MGINIKIASDFENALLKIDKITAENIVQKELLDAQVDIFNIIDYIISPALESIGHKWENGDIALSQEYMASKITEEIINEILPLDNPQRNSKPKIGITTLEDQHMLGKQILRSLINSTGFNLTDYGSISIENIKEKIKSDNIEVLFISTLMLNQALTIKEVTEFIELEKTNTKVIVGGAPFLFDDGLWKEVNATAMAKTAVEGLHIAQELMGEL
ncbi:cobalamin B12-binding domain-containing protein [Methanococcoides burtonii]|uniref:Dimethylamine corrinoid protein n=1 Tax=Methanococcoides burtonii (strain DSM 6242 / NBRC 107633 / OCM 468 / ACE-M) TaxID=259564 RepID=Q12XC8_METBU|nr:B12-binding domain-containing protein [Methanococcoides burtonii]ABE51898.1 Dimethylamine corrinoid protein [Methanococcoides burtonii DSM 6242]